jgi:acetyltransferase-like isoleucine patch superfamily enzyme
VAEVTLTPSDRAPGLLLGDAVTLPDDAEIGANVIIHSGTRLGSGCSIQDGGMIGKPLKLSPRSTSPSESPPPASLGDDAAVCAGAVVLAGAEIGEGAVIGDQAHVRERARIGAETVIGWGSEIDRDVTIGDRVKVQSNCYITAGTVIEDDVFVGPGVTMTNDNTMDRHGPEFEFEGPLLRRACRVGGGTVLCPGVEIGEEAFVAAGALVTADVPARAVVMGLPARVVREVSDEDLLERWR